MATGKNGCEETKTADGKSMSRKRKKRADEEMTGSGSSNSVEKQSTPRERRPKRNDDNTLEWEIRKRLPPRFGNAKNDVYITRKTQLAAQFKRCKTLLDRQFDTVIIHALGRAINRALKLALKLEDAMLHSVKLDVLTSSVTVTDDLISFLDADETKTRERELSAVHIQISRLC